MRRKLVRVPRKTIRAMLKLRDDPDVNPKRLYSRLYPVIGLYVEWTLGHGWLTYEGRRFLANIEPETS